MKIKETMMETKDKAKIWCKKHERGIRDAGWYLWGATIGGLSMYFGMKMDYRYKLGKAVDNDLKSIGEDARNYDAWIYSPVPESSIKRPWIVIGHKDDLGSINSSES